LPRKFYFRSPLLSGGITHLHRYVKEFAFRHNTSQVGTMQFINMTIDRMVSKHLTYEELIRG
jgi:hypothetical protein